MSPHVAWVAVVVVTSGGLAAGCTSPEASRPGPIEPIDLRVALGDPDPEPTGVAIDQAGRRYVFDETSGLYAVGAGGAVERIMARDAMPEPDVPVRPPFTDLVALDDGRFAITALGDGYLLDVARGTMQQYFCYVPDELPPDYDQRTDAVTYDPVARLIHAQPRTFDVDGTLIASQIASYAFQTGVDVDWLIVDPSIAAGGMAMLPDGRLLLGDGTRLLARADFAVVEVDDLARFGIERIGGLAIDAAAGTLLVLDDARDRLVELELADLRD